MLYIKRTLQFLFWAPILGLAIFVVPAVYEHNCSIDGNCSFLSLLGAFFGAGIWVYLASFVYYFIFTFWTGWRPFKVRKNGEASILYISRGFLPLQLLLILLAVICAFELFVGPEDLDGVGPLVFAFFLFFILGIALVIFFPNILILSVFDLKAELLRYTALTFFGIRKFTIKFSQIKAVVHQEVPIRSMPHEVVFVDVIDDEQRHDRLVVVRGRDLDAKTTADQITEFMKKTK